VTTGPEQPSQPWGGTEYAPLEDSPQPSDPNAPVDYPTNPGLPPPVYGAAYSGPPGYPPPPGPPGYPPPGYPPPGYAPPPGYPVGPPGYQPYAGGYPYAVDPYDPYRQMKPQGTNGKAIAALATSLGGLLFCGVPSIVGLVLGVIAMRETKRTGQEGYGLALAGVIVGGLVVLGWVAYVVLIIGLAASGAFDPTYHY
jgi:hypothetical protein